MSALRSNRALRWLPTAWLAGAALLAGGCQWERQPEQKRINSYLAEPADLASVRRVMVLPFRQESNVEADVEKVRDAFVAELQKLRRFEVVPLPSTAAENELLRDSLRRGRLSTEATVRLCERYGLDAIFLGTVTAWRPYTPAHLAMRTQLLSVHSGAPVWAVDAMYDTSDRSTVSDLRHYMLTQKQDDGSLHGWELKLLAPQQFTQYVANRFVGTWSDA
jgi:TolB-like protein